MSGEKTEQPTDKRLRDAREQGQVMKSQEIPATAVVLAVFVFVWAGYDWAAGEFKRLMLLSVSCIGMPFQEAVAELAPASLRAFAVVALPCVALAALAGTAGHLVQTGVVFAFKAAAPKLDKLNPKQWFSKVFSIKNLIEFIRSIVKIGVIAAVFYLVFMDALPWTKWSTP